MSQSARRVAVVVLALSLAALSGCKRDGTSGGSGSARSSGLKRIVILTNGPDPFWDTCQAGAKAAEKDLQLSNEGYVVDFQRGDFTDKKQIDMVKQYALASDIAAVGISVYNPDSRNLAEELRLLQKKGVTVVTIDGDLNREKFRDARFAYLGTDNFVAGRELGRAGRALDDDGAEFAFFVGNLGAANAIDRMAGFVAGIGENSHELSRLDDGGDKTKARKNVEDTIDRHPHCDMYVGIWAYNTPQIVSAIRDRDIKQKVRVMCFDAAQQSIREMKNGNVDVMVVQNPYQMGYDGVTLMLAMLTENQAVIDEMFPDYAPEGERDLFRTELRVVVPDEGSPVTPGLFDSTTQFFKLSEFVKWLSDRGLVSS